MHKSALPLPPLQMFHQIVRYSAPKCCADECAPPINGGLPTNASKPARSTKTSGNSSGQWNRPAIPAFRNRFFASSSNCSAGKILELVLDLSQHPVECRLQLADVLRLPGRRQEHVGGVPQPLRLILHVLQHLGLALDVLRRVRGQRLDLLAEQHRRLEPLLDLLPLLLHERSDLGVLGHREPEQLVDAAEPHQRVAAPDGMVQERERLVLRQRQQPERQLRHLDRQRVLVHAVDAPLSHQTAGVDQPLLAIEGDQLLVGQPRRDLAVGRDPG